MWCRCQSHIEGLTLRTHYAAKDAGRDVRIVRPLHADVDHGLSIYHRENEYLKGLMLYVV